MPAALPILYTMKVLTPKRSITTSREFKTHRYDLDPAGTAHILHILRNQLYSDKMLAVIREYTTNAQDAHVEAGKPKASIRITLPTQTDPVFRVRDFGLGISHARMGTLFTKIGKSTKRSSNTTTGYLGLGCKSGFAYCDSYSVSSFRKRKVSIYQAYLDKTQKGELALLRTLPTDEPDGLEIAVPIQLDDIPSFVATAVKFLALFDPTPILVHGSLPQVIPLVSDPITGSFILGQRRLHAGTWIYPNGGKFDQSVTLSYEGQYVRMGNVIYPLQTKYLTNIQRIYLPAIFNVPIGSVTVAATRESLEYTPETIAYLQDFLPQVIKRIQQAALENILAQPTLIHAREKFEHYHSLLPQATSWVSASGKSYPLCQEQPHSPTLIRLPELPNTKTHGPTCPIPLFTLLVGVTPREHIIRRVWDQSNAKDLQGLELHLPPMRREAANTILRIIHEKRHPRYGGYIALTAESAELAKDYLGAAMDLVDLTPLQEAKGNTMIAPPFLHKGGLVHTREEVDLTKPHYYFPRSVYAALAKEMLNCQDTLTNFLMELTKRYVGPGRIYCPEDALIPSLAHWCDIDEKLKELKGQHVPAGSSSYQLYQKAAKQVDWKSLGKEHALNAAARGQPLQLMRNVYAPKATLAKTSYAPLKPLTDRYGITLDCVEHALAAYPLALPTILGVKPIQKQFVTYQGIKDPHLITSLLDYIRVTDSLRSSD